VPAVDEHHRLGIERLFEAFNRRDVEAITELCDERMEFFAVTAEEVGRSEPYVGVEGMRAYLDDVATVWEELLITPKHVEQREDSLLVRGRVYLRSRALGIRDMPTAWIWELRDGRFVRGRVFVDPEEAIRLFSLEGQPGQNPDSGAPRSTTRLQ
jgi:ketosteroid isomerase-like protein